MSVKTFTFRYDSDGDIGKWLASQGKKNESLELAIQILIGNFDYQDLRDVISRQVPLGIEAVKPRKTKVPKPRKTKAKKKTKVSPKQPSKDKPKENEVEDNDEDTNLGMFSSL